MAKDKLFNQDIDTVQTPPETAEGQGEQSIVEQIPVKQQVDPAKKRPRKKKQPEGLQDRWDRGAKARAIITDKQGFRHVSVRRAEALQKAGKIDGYEIVKNPNLK